MSEFQVSKQNYVECRIVNNDLSEQQLNDGQVLVKVDKFALTANNITYAVVADQIGYWQFFPPHATSKENEADLANWGVLPVWGYADVVKSSNAEVPVGERLFGYFPPATHLIMHPSNVSPLGWIDSSKHRADLPTAYNLYRKVEAEPGYNKAFEDERMLLYPLHVTSFALYDYFQSNDWFGATQLVMISASSKTSTGLAYGLQNDEKAPAQVALTSERNVKMVESLGVYQQTLTYQQISEIDATQPTLIVDMSGNGQVLNDLHKHLGDNMKFCSNVGLTHWKEMETGPDFITSRSEFFFAPSQLQKRIKEWGMEGFEKHSGKYLAHSFAKSREWLKMTNIDGLQGMAAIYPDLCEGKVAPEAGLLICMSKK
ncbi:MAG: hypothetical protein ACI9O6_000191 [Glaciecola sp.]|jgi:hypothetical protein